VMSQGVQSGRSACHSFGRSRSRVPEISRPAWGASTFHRSFAMKMSASRQSC